MSLLCHNTAEAQVSFGYDSSGNRISRVINMSVRSQQIEEKSEKKIEQKIHSEELKDFSIKIYPNPTKGDITFEIQNLPEGKTANMKLYDISGALVLQKTNIKDKEYLNISNWPEGVYIAKISAGDSTTEWKIIKQ